MLRANVSLNMRLFEINAILSRSVVENFFNQVLEAVSNDLCNVQKKKRQELTQPECFEYRCKCDIGCTKRALCLDGCDQCNLFYNDFDSERTCVEQGGGPVANECRRCVPSISKDEWTICHDFNPCTTDECGPGNKCVHEPVCTPECGYCKINNECYVEGAKRDDSGCEVCDPNNSPFGWTRTAFCTEPPTPLPTPLPVGASQMPTPAPTPSPPCASLATCDSCVATPNNDPRPCQWCYLAGADGATQGECTDESGGCSVANAFSVTLATGTCPISADPPSTTDGSSETSGGTAPPPTTATTVEETPSPTPAPTPDPGRDGRCGEGMQPGDARILPVEWNEPKRYCVCSDALQLICARSPDECVLQASADDCEARAGECCFRETVAGGICLDNNNPLCKKPQKDDPFGRPPDKPKRDMDVIEGGASVISLALAGVCIVIAALIL